MYHLILPAIDQTIYEKIPELKFTDDEIRRLENIDAFTYSFIKLTQEKKNWAPIILEDLIKEWRKLWESHLIEADMMDFFCSLELLQKKEYIETVDLEHKTYAYPTPQYSQYINELSTKFNH